MISARMTEVVITRCDPTRTTAQCILRPISTDFHPVSGVSRDIGLSAGAELLSRLDEYDEIPNGAAVVTPAGALPCEVLIHVSIQDREEPTSGAAVERGFLNGLRRAAALGLESLVTPTLGMGATGLDAEGAAQAMGRALSQHRLDSDLPGRIEIAVASDYELDVFTRLVTEVEGGA